MVSKATAWKLATTGVVPVVTGVTVPVVTGVTVPVVTGETGWLVTGAVVAALVEGDE